MNNNRSNNEWILGGLFLLIILAMAAEQAQGLFVLLILGALLFAARRAEGWGGRRASSRFYGPARQDVGMDTADPVQSANAEPVYKHALAAVYAAGLDPDAVQVLPVDIGLMAFKGEDDPVVYRTWSLPDDLDYVQPFVQLRLPTKASGRIRFEIVDSEGETLFIHEDQYQLVRGRNLITPPARLPVHDAQVTDGEWSLLVSADGVLLAQHQFDWVEAATSTLRRHLSEDGEITSEMRAALTESRLQRLSLDELLADQTEGGDEQQQQSRR